MGFFPSEVLWGHAYCDLSMGELKKEWTSTEVPCSFITFTLQENCVWLLQPLLEVFKVY